MKFAEFEQAMSTARMAPYLLASNGNTRKAMLLYRKNLQLSQALFSVIGCLEVVLRNRINEHYLTTLGDHWLRKGVERGAMFDHPGCRMTQHSILEAVIKLDTSYSHNRLVTELGFGFWRFLFAKHQYRVAGRTLLQIFTSLPPSSPRKNYNHTYIFNRLMNINTLRNRVLRHEPHCFSSPTTKANCSAAKKTYRQILKLLQWMDIDDGALLYGLDHVPRMCDEIDSL